MTRSRRETEIDAGLHERAMDEAPVGITISDATREDNPLIYANEAFERITGYPREEILGGNCRILQGEESDPEAIAAMGEAVREGEAVSVELVNYRRDGESFWNEVTIAPLRDDTGRITNFVGFQNDVTGRKEAELELQRERVNLDQLLTRIRGLVSDVTRDLVEAESREEVERRVVNRFAKNETYSFAWIGRNDRSDRQITPQAWAGEFDGADPELTVDLEDDHPITHAIRTHRVEITDGEDGDAARAGGDTDSTLLTGDGDGGAAIVPLSDGRTCYGVLLLGAVRLADIDRREIAVLESLGRAIAVTLNALQSRRILSTDSFIEIELEVTDGSLFFVDLSDRCECRFEYRGSVRNEDGALSMFFMTDRSPEQIDCQLSSTDVDHVHSVSSGEEWGLFEFSVGVGSLVADLADRGVRTRSISAENGLARIRIELPPELDSRSITDRFRDRYPSTELVGYHVRERPPITREEFVERVMDRLTDRQLTALQRAYLGGYYDQPRTISGDELADSMGVTRATFHQHLRAAERKLLSEFLYH